VKQSARRTRFLVAIKKICIGMLSPDTANRPHFQSFQKLLPADVELINEGLGLLRSSYGDLAGKSDEVIARSMEFVATHQVRGLMMGGGFLTLFNPGLEAKVSEAIHRPVTAAVSAVTAALRALSLKTLLLMTPFSAEMNRVIKNHFDSLGLKIFLGPPFDNRKPGAPVDLGCEKLFQMVAEEFKQNPATEAIYFQGATMDPLPIIQRLEDELGVTVVTSNQAMLWHLLTQLGLKYSIEGYGKLLSTWPVLTH
jgi:maleate cis-trans isomerase